MRLWRKFVRWISGEAAHEELETLAAKAFENYRAWADAQVCVGCGDSRETSDKGWWPTEDWCGCKIAGGYVDKRPKWCEFYPEELRKWIR